MFASENALLKRGFVVAAQNTSSSSSRRTNAVHVKRHPRRRQSRKNERSSKTLVVTNMAKPPSNSAVSNIRVEKSEVKPGCVVELSVAVPMDVLAISYENAIDEAVAQAEIPGFEAPKKKDGSRKKSDTKRPPMNMLLKAVGKDTFLQLCIEDTLQNTLPQAMQFVAKEAIQDSETIATTPRQLAEAFGGPECTPSKELEYVIKFGGDVRQPGERRNR
jgi:hypothetical protein